MVNPSKENILAITNNEIELADLVAEWRRAGILTDFDEPIQQPANDANQQNNADAITMKIGEEQWNDTPLDRKYFEYFCDWKNVIFSQEGIIPL
jgi:hypothetical protein